jgi:hypothetical protein
VVTTVQLIRASDISDRSTVQAVDIMDIEIKTLRGCDDTLFVVQEF